jgi:hypothetical protein
MKSRKSKGEKGGVAKIVFLAAGLALEGYMHGKKPFMDFIVRWLPSLESPPLEIQYPFPSQFFLSG